DARRDHARGSRRMRLSLLLTLALTACSSGKDDGSGREPAAASRGASASIAFEAREPLSVDAVRPRLAPVRVHDPYEARAVTFLAVPAAELLDERFGHAWREADEVVFACADGYRVGVPVRRLV